MSQTPRRAVDREFFAWIEEATRRALKKQSRRTTFVFFVIVVIAIINQYRVEHSVSRIQELREERVEAQRASDIIICENQEEALVRLSETKSIVLSLTEGFAKLRVPQKGVELTPEESERAKLFQKADNKLTRGIARINDRIVELNCKELPGNAPFRR